MSKRIALTDYIEIDGTDLSNYARQVGWSSEHAEVDVSGFNVGGTDETLAGSTKQAFTVEFYDSKEVRNVVYHLHKNRDIFPIVWRTDGANVVSDDNPELQGNVQALQYAPTANRGDTPTFSVTFSAADSDGLYYVAT